MYQFTPNSRLMSIVYQMSIFQLSLLDLDSFICNTWHDIDRYFHQLQNKQFDTAEEIIQWRN